MPTAAVCPNPSCAKKLTVPDGVVAPKCPACRTLVAPSKASGTAPAAPLTTPRSGDPDPPAAQPADAAPERVGRFVVLGMLGAGAFGTVYRARDPQLDREVALKVPNAGVLGDAKRTERFLREAKAAAQLRHPNIVPVFDAGREGDRYFIASAFVDGTPLSEQVGENGMDIRRAAEIVRQLAGAVGYAHEQGIVHRDIKPANVMLDGQDRPHLMDFGLAARADEAEKLTSDGAVMGTPAYMSPEQAGGQRSDPMPAWDQYALGVVLYELLTGRTPFSGPPAAVIFQVLNNDPPTPRAVRPYITRDLETICLKAMSREPGKRFSGCEELARDLGRWLAGELIYARKPNAVMRGAWWVSRNRVAASAFLIVLISLTVASIVSTRSAARAINEAREANVARTDAETNARNAREQAKRADAAEAVAGRRAQELDERIEELTGTRAGATKTGRTLAETQAQLAQDREHSRTRAEAINAELVKVQMQLDQYKKLIDDAGTLDLDPAGLESDPNYLRKRFWALNKEFNVLVKHAIADSKNLPTRKLHGSMLAGGSWKYRALHPGKNPDGKYFTIERSHDVQYMKNFKYRMESNVTFIGDDITTRTYNLPADVTEGSYTCKARADLEGYLVTHSRGGPLGSYVVLAQTNNGFVCSKDGDYPYYVMFNTQPTPPAKK